MKNMTRKRKILMRVLVIAALAAVVLFVTQMAAAATVYSTIFARRFETGQAYRYSADEFPGLTEETVKFTNNSGTELSGYFYKCIEGEPKGLVVICHGFGGDANQFMDSAAFFAGNGFAVFSFDVTGSGKSGGSGAGGFPQYTMDLMSAIDFAKGLPEMQGLPVMLLGHSMGAYAAVNVFNFRDDVSAAALLAGFEKSIDLINAGGAKLAGPLVKLISPLVKLWESIKFGRFSTGEGVRRLVESDAGVLVAQSTDDDNVPFSIGFERFLKAAAGDKDFEFVELTGRGHDCVDFSLEATEYVKAFDWALEEFKASGNVTPEEIDAFITDNLDRSVWENTLDPGLYGRILALFENAAAKAADAG